MPRIKIKRAASKVPVVTDLQSGELALNEATGVVYIGIGGTANANTVAEVNSVRTVAGKSPTAGAITLTASDVGAANSSHTHAISHITNLQTTLDGKAASSHTHTIANVTNLQSSLDAKVDDSEKGAASGVATLDSNGKLPTTQLPALAVTEYLGTVATEALMLGLSGQKGDWTIRSDSGAVWIVTGDTPSQIGSWTQLSYPAAPVTSVAGKTGTVTLASSDVGLGNVPNTNCTNAGNITSGTLASARLPDLAVSDFAAAAIQLSSESFVDNDTTLMTAAAIEDRILSKGYITSNAVTSVAGKTGAVTLVKGDVGLGNVANSDTTNASNISSGTLNADRLPTIDGGTY
jgi:hypothetical protein